MAAETIDNGLEDNVQMPLHAINQQCELELKQRRNTKCLSLKKKPASKHCNDPLLWWKKHAITFPTLARLAQKFMGIEASSAASEYIFSKAQRITTADRNRLKLEIIGSLLCVSTNLESYENHIKESHSDEIYGQCYTADDDPDEDNDKNEKTISINK